MIDWSKAPKGAVEVKQHDEGFIEFFDNKGKYFYADGSWTHPYKLSEWKTIATRPAEPNIIDVAEMKKGMVVRCVDRDASHKWYEIGDEYVVGFDESGDFGPLKEHCGASPSIRRYKFTLVNEPERKTVKDAIEAHPDGLPDSAFSVYYSDRDHKWTYEAGCYNYKVCSRHGFYLEVERQKGEQLEYNQEEWNELCGIAQEWTHTCDGDKCRVLIDKPDCVGYVVILVDGRGYDLVRQGELKPIKPTITKAEAWDKISQTYLMCGWSLKDAVKDIEKVYEVR